MIEVGANVGVFTVWIERRLRACPKIKGIFAFEPSLEAFRRLLKNCAANDCRRVSLINMALSDKPGVLSFFEPSGHLTNGSFSKSFAELFSADVKETYVSVGTGSMIEMLINCGDSLLFKLDAEGHEAAVILGLAPLFSKANVDLLIEVLPSFEENILSALTAVCENDQPLRVGERDRLFKCRPKIGDVGSACSVQR